VNLVAFDAARMDLSVGTEVARSERAHLDLGADERRVRHEHEGAHLIPDVQHEPVEGSRTLMVREPS
jgi:hypothetical protein